MSKPKNGTLTQQARTALAAQEAIVRASTDPGVVRRFLTTFEAPHANTPMEWQFRHNGITTLPPANKRDATLEILKHRGKVVADAPTYILSQEMLDIAVTAALTLSPADLAGLKEADLPSKRGFMYLPRVLRVVNPLGPAVLTDVQAVSWGFGPIFQDNGLWTRGFRFTTWTPIEGTDSNYQAMLAQYQGHWLPPLIFHGLGTIDPELFLRQDFAAQHASVARLRKGLHGLPPLEDLITATHSRGDAIKGLPLTFFQGLVFAFARLCEQDIAENTPLGEHIPAIGRKGGPEADVRLVSLRPKRPRPHGESDTVTWSHRWVVQMHKRRQWYPASKEHRVIFVGPYLKGPEGKPLKHARPSVGVLR